MSEMGTGTIIGFVVIGGLSIFGCGGTVLWLMRLNKTTAAPIYTMEKTAEPFSMPTGLPGVGDLTGLPGVGDLTGLPGVGALTDLTSGKISGDIASKIPIPGGAATLTSLAIDKMPSNIEMSTFSKGDNPLTAMAGSKPLSVVAGGKLPDMTANKTNAVIAEQTADAEKAVAVNTKETKRQLRLAAAEKRKNLEASIPVSDIIPSRVNNIISVGKDGTITQIPKLTSKIDTSGIFTYGEGEGNVTNTPSSNPVKKGGGKKTKSKRTKLTNSEPRVKKSVKRQKKPRTKKCLIEKDNKMYMSFCI